MDSEEIERELNFFDEYSTTKSSFPVASRRGF